MLRSSDSAISDPGATRAKDFLGEGALMDDYPHSTSARALLPTRVFLISRDAFFSMFEEHPAMAMKILLLGTVQHD